MAKTASRGKKFKCEQNLSMIGISWLVFLPGSTVTVVECRGLSVVEAIFTLPGEDLGLALIEILVYIT